MANQQTVTTGVARWSYEHLITPHAVDPAQEPKYSVTLLIPKSDTRTKALIDAAINAAIEAGTSGQRPVWTRKPSAPRTPVWDGDGTRQNGEPFNKECHGHWVLTASSRTRVKIYDTNLQEIIDPSQIYSGAYGRACVRFFPFAKAGNSGIGCGLEMVQKTADGEPLAGASAISAAEAFGTPVASTTPAGGIDPLTGLPF